MYVQISLPHIQRDANLIEEQPFVCALDYTQLKSGREYLAALEERLVDLFNQGYAVNRLLEYRTHYMDVMLQRMIDQYGEKKGNRLFRAFFHSYHHADIIDTGVYDCRSEEYLARAQMQADMIHSELSTVPGSNILLEKLVSGRWDEQFVVVEPGQTIDKHMFV